MPDPLNLLERRILGSLVEKALTAASPEPLSLNAVVVACNQKSNRDPVLNVEEPEVDSCLEGLQKKGLVFRIVGGRVERWRHNLYDAWELTKPELALLGELLLRGPQTAAEARTRASRMEPFDHELAATTIKGLVERNFVVWLTPEERRGAILTHGFESPETQQRLKAAHAAGFAPTEPDLSSRMSSSTEPRSSLNSRLDNALGEISRLRLDVDHLRSQFADIQKALGIDAPGSG